MNEYDRVFSAGGHPFPGRFTTGLATRKHPEADPFERRLCKFYMSHLLCERFVWLFLHVGDLAIQFFCTLPLVCGFYLLKLLLHAVSLRGGRHNFDNLVRVARGASSWIPLQMGQPLCGKATPLPRRRGRTMRGCGYSRDLWLLLAIVCYLCNLAAAARGQVPPDLRPNFRMDPGQYTGAEADNTPLMILPQAAQQEDSDPESEPEDSSSSSSASVAHHNVLFRAFGFGYVPEHHAVRLRCGTALFRALQLIDVDIEVATRSSRGQFVPLMGAPIDESYPILWVPRWIEHTGKRLAVLDATHVGWESSVLVFEDSIVNVRIISEMLQHI